MQPLPVPIASCRVDSPVGPIFAMAKDGVLIGLEFDDQPGRIEKDLRQRFGTVELTACPDPVGIETRLKAYFAGDIRALEDVPTDGGGTEFQRRVWAELKRIPAGTTICYAELARRIGNPKAMRAVGLANGRNPISIAVPCHRVIGADGSLTGYGGGLERKRWLLRHEDALPGSLL